MVEQYDFVTKLARTLHIKSMLMCIWQFSIMLDMFYIHIQNPANPDNCDFSDNISDNYEFLIILIFPMSITSLSVLFCIMINFTTENWHISHCHPNMFPISVVQMILHLSQVNEFHIRSKGALPYSHDWFICICKGVKR